MILRYPILITLALCAHGIKLHEHMTKQEIETTFNCDHKLVHELEYEVTPVLHVDGLTEQGRAVPRSHSAVHLRAFDKNISLYLSENDNLLLGSHTPLFTAKRGRGGRSLDGHPRIVYSRMPFPVPEKLKLYHDMENRAAVTVFTDDDNQAHVYGTVGEDYVIKPIPKRLHKEVLPMLPEFHQSSFSYQSRDPFSDDPFFSDPFSGNSLNGNFYKPTHHIVMKPKIQVNSAYYDPNTGRWVHLQQQTHNIKIDDLKNQLDGWNSFKQQFARPSTTASPKKPNNYPPVHQLPFVSRPQVNWPPQFNLTTKAPVHQLPFTHRPQVNWQPHFNPTTKAPVHRQPFTQRPQVNWQPHFNPTTKTPVHQQPFTQRPQVNWQPHFNPTTKAPVHQQPFTQRPQVNWQPHFNPTTKAPVHLPSYRLPTQHPKPKLPITQRPTFKQPVTPPSTPVRPVKPVAEHSDTVYPELLVSTDYETYAAHGSDLNELSKYMAAFWNAVDLRFRELSHPKVRLNIAGLIVPQSRDSAPYFEDSHVTKKAIQADTTVSDVGKYFAKEEQFPKSMYDIAVAMSHMDLGSFTPNGKFNDGTTGIAMLEGACKVESGQAAALIRDKGGFNGITTAAHELAHSMGAPHDGDDTRDMPGGPCAWSDGYLMSYERKDSKGMHWSRCSKMALSKYLSSPEAKCMRNKPDVGNPYPKILPGKMLSRDEQCARSLGAGWFSHKEEESNCAVLHCRKPVSEIQYQIMTENRPPAEGSYCGEGSICLDAQCVKDPTVK